MSLLAVCDRPETHAQHLYTDEKGRTRACLGREEKSVKFERNYAAEEGERITYAAGVDEPVHPDFAIAMRLKEVAMSDCTYGCKIYADSRSRLRVLAHNRIYGCTVTKKELLQ